jgi:hypothetical protein
MAQHEWPLKVRNIFDGMPKFDAFEVAKSLPPLLTN